MTENLNFHWSDLAFGGHLRPNLAVLGNPVRHSLSPAMHNAALKDLGERDKRFQKWRYVGIEVPVESLQDLLSQLWALQFQGVNLTLPHKVEALKWVDEIDDEAAQIGAVNTLLRTDRGWKGYNTDGFGILKAIKQSLNINVSGRDVILFGAGGAARAIAVACLNANCMRLTLINRSEDRLLNLLHNLKTIDAFEKRAIRGFSSENFPDDFELGSVAINATSLGLKISDPAPIQIKNLTTLKPFVYDTTYGCDNQLYQDCLSCEIPYGNGLSMLVWQGVKSLSIWTNEEISEKIMAEAAFFELTKRRQDKKGQ